MTRADRIIQKLEDLIDDLHRRSKRRNSADDILALKERLHMIDEEYQEAAIHERDGTVAPGQAVISELLAEAHDLSSELMEDAEDDY